MKLVPPSDPPRIDPMLSLERVQDAVGLKHSTIYLLMKRGEFPRCIKLTARTVRWKQSEILKWLEERTAASTATDAQLTLGDPQGGRHA